MLFRDIKQSVRSFAASAVFCALAALPVHAATYFVSTTGVDSPSRNGLSAETAWKTVAYAAKKTQMAGDVIQVGGGIFAETEEIFLAPKVNLIGVGQADTIITLGERPASAGKKLLVLRSDAVTTGQQTISHLTLDGKNHTAPIGIHLRLRDYVTLHDITVQNFEYYGVLVEGRGFDKGTFIWPQQMPSAEYWVSHLEIYDSTFLNSGRVEPGTNWAYGTVTIYQLKDSIIRNCVFDESVYGGFNLKGTWGSNVKIYDNTFKLAAHWPNLKAGKSCGLEYWFLDNSEIYNNQTNGALSLFASNSEIHDNQIVMPPGEGKIYGIEICGPSVRIDHNFIDGAIPAIAYWGEAFPGLYIENNVIRGGSILISAGQNQTGDYAFKDIFIWNNTIDLAVAAYNQGAAIGARIQFPNGSIDGLDIRNNIITNPQGISAVSLTGANGGSDANVKKISNTVVTHNLFLGTTGDDVRDKGSINRIEHHNLTQTDPGYTGGSVTPDPYYRLQAVSPAINRGVDVALPYFGPAPDIGAYEFAGTTRYEAETSYTVPAGFDVGSAAISVRNRELDSGSSVSVYDSGDTIRIPFSVPASGPYTLKVRLRCGGANNSRELYWPNGYGFTVDGAAVTLTGDSASISAFDANSDGGVFWGTMQNLAVPLAAGAHFIDIRANYTWGMIDYFEVVQ